MIAGWTEHAPASVTCQSSVNIQLPRDAGRPLAYLPSVVLLVVRCRRRRLTKRGCQHPSSTTYVQLRRRLAYKCRCTRRIRHTRTAGQSAGPVGRTDSSTGVFGPGTIVLRAGQPCWATRRFVFLASSTVLRYEFHFGPVLFVLAFSLTAIRSSLPGEINSFYSFKVNFSHSSWLGNWVAE